MMHKCEVCRRCAVKSTPHRLSIVQISSLIPARAVASAFGATRGAFFRGSSRKACNASAQMRQMWKRRPRISTHSLSSPIGLQPLNGPGHLHVCLVDGVAGDHWTTRKQVLVTVGPLHTSRPSQGKRLRNLKVRFCHPTHCGEWPVPTITAMGTLLTVTDDNCTAT